MKKDSKTGKKCITTVGISREINKKLMILKLDLQLKTKSDVVKVLLLSYETRKGVKF